MKPQLKACLTLTAAAIAIGAAVLIWNADMLNLIFHADIQSILQLAGGNLPLLLSITMVLMIIQNLFTIIPLLLLISVNISMFGFVYGYLWSWMTSIAGAVAAFYIVRGGFQRFIAKHMNRKLIERIERNSFQAVLIGRLFPMMPTSIINAAAGLSSVPVGKFIMATVIGNFIYFFALSLIPVGLASDSIASYGLVIVAAILFSGYWYYRRRLKKGRIELLPPALPGTASGSKGAVRQSPEQLD
ncbi:TVP38/TMEM64 family protein [Paenibacillus pinihumi]|uniref:TVP38/TMEM64 family protein n=1 Tax=Paenibacillus pinihumi TaxID=669462 RepID=UPI0003FF6BA7|nr:VTT domain-containing protein [Paenibacillus pinihumi]